MSLRSVVLVLCVAALPVASAAAAPIGATYKVVHSGAVAPMGFHYYLADGCRSTGPVAINLITPPQNGEITTGPRTAHPSFRFGDPLAACNKVRVGGLEVYYQSAPGYVGPDSYVVERVFPNGDAQRFRIDVSVR